MVRHGRLSKGCQTCRKRKIKCDQALPGCSQCRKAGWKCPQYGDAVERMFLYQDTDQLKRQPGPKSVKPPRAPLTQAHPGECDVVSFTSIPGRIQQSVNDRAIEYFLFSHAFRDDGGLRGFYEYLPTYGISRTDPELLTTLTATALAAFGKRLGNSDVLRQARHYYGRSLRLVNHALQCPIKVRKDSTIIAILLLNTFEGLMSDGRMSLAYSDGHMRGELMIMTLRGPKLLATRQGMQVFLHMSRCLITYCTLRPARLPEEVIELRKHAAQFMDTTSPAWVLEETMIKLAAFRADVNDGVFTDSEMFIAHAYQLDNELSALSNDMPPEWSFKRHDLQLTEGCGTLAYCHVYPDLWVTYTWNYIRACRLFLHKEVANWLTSIGDNSPLFFRALEFRRSSHTVQQLVLDICASVPQYLGESSTLTTDKDPSANLVPGVAGAYFLIWPLLIAGDMTESATQRDWIIRQCRSISQITGIQRIAIVAESLERGECFL
ncbi:hypothetical protein BJX70DRAFT_386890 [Aspergillus crustosus]